MRLKHGDIVGTTPVMVNYLSEYLLIKHGKELQETLNKKLKEIKGVPRGYKIEIRGVEIWAIKKDKKKK